MPATEALFDIIDAYMRVRCEVCGQPSGDPGPVIRAAQIVLDRTGFGPSASLTLNHVRVPPPWIEWLTDEQLATVAAFMRDATARMEAGAPPWRMANLDIPTSDDAVLVEPAEPTSMEGESVAPGIDTAPIRVAEGEGVN
jgi:hypothetical protein